MLYNGLAIRWSEICELEDHSLLAYGYPLIDIRDFAGHCLAIKLTALVFYFSINS